MLNMGFNACLSQKKWLNPSGFNTSLFGLASQQKAPKIKFWKIA